MCLHQYGNNITQNEGNEFVRIGTIPFIYDVVTSEMFFFIVSIVSEASNEIRTMQITESETLPFSSRIMKA
jgi:hypothetical protein